VKAHQYFNRNSSCRQRVGYRIGLLAICPFIIQSPTSEQTLPADVLCQKLTLQSQRQRS
jgi:hypothetical protein